MDNLTPEHVQVLKQGMNEPSIIVKRSERGTYSAFLETYPEEYKKIPNKIHSWDGAKNAEQAVLGIKSIYPELFETSIPSVFESLKNDGTWLPPKN